MVWDTRTNDHLAMTGRGQNMGERVLSGIQPTDVPHIGNYIGALRHWVSDQDARDCFFVIVDLHAITVPQEPSDLREATLDLAAALLAVGIDPHRSTLFVQSHVSEHAELAWVLGCFTTYGELQRMTQFKDRTAKRQTDIVSAGLFTYPVLQAADVLIYQADRVPVGEDQRQHLELTRDVARRFNQRYGETFILPQAAIPRQGAKIMDLQDPTAKMSTTYGSDAGLVYIDDEPDTIVKKIKRAQTDSGSDVVRSPEKAGITNLIDIYSVARGVPPEEVEREFDGQGYGAFKGAVGEAVAELLAPTRERYAELRADEAGLERALARGAERAREIAVPVMADVHSAMGLGPRA
jgi:tryptophanyl-tRNA synthetase